MANRYYEGPASDHFDGERFFHPGLPSSDKSLFEVLRWKILGKRTPWPVSVPARSGLHPQPRVEDIQITAIGHASLLIQVAGSNILVDPVWAERASPLRRFGPKRHNPAAIALGDLPQIHSVLLTHNHYDHMDLATIEKIWDSHHPYMLAPLGNDRVVRSKVPRVQVTAGDWWESFDLSHGIRATIVPAYHWSSRGLGDQRMALWGGFVLETPMGVIYCAGDTAYRDGKIFHEIRKRFGPAIVAILPIGAYAPRWFMKTQHVNPEEALQIASDCGAQQMLGIHWGTFALTDEAYNEPETLLAELSLPASLKSIALHPGDTWRHVTS